MGDGILFLALKNLVISVARLIIFSNQFLDTEEISGNTIKILFKEKSSNVLLLHKKASFRECQIHYTWDYTLKSNNHQCMNDNMIMVIFPSISKTMALQKKLTAWSQATGLWHQRKITSLTTINKLEPSTGSTTRTTISVHIWLEIKNRRAAIYSRMLCELCLVSALAK